MAKRGPGLDIYEAPVLDKLLDMTSKQLKKFLYTFYDFPQGVFDGLDNWDYQLRLEEIISRTEYKEYIEKETNRTVVSIRTISEAKMQHCGCCVETSENIEVVFADGLTLQSKDIENWSDYHLTTNIFRDGFIKWGKK